MGYDVLKLAEDYTVATDDVEIILGEPMREHTSFRLGGSAEMFIKPFTEEALSIGLGLCHRREIPYWILGKGTNLLVSDRGVRGAVFDMTGLDAWHIEGDLLYAQAGCPLRVIAKGAADESLTGLEFAHGIPGSLGGAVTMNAGAFGSEMKDLLVSARLMNAKGECRDVPAEELGLGYRKSAMEETGDIVVSAVLKLTKGDREAIEARMKELWETRLAHQPLNTRNAGSTFKRPAGYFAGKLIDEAGLKGFQIGGAQVSEKHAGFVVSDGTATASEVYKLCREVTRIVKERSGVELEMEVRTWGSF